MIVCPVYIYIQKTWVVIWNLSGYNVGNLFLKIYRILQRHCQKSFFAWSAPLCPEEWRIKHIFNLWHGEQQLMRNQTSLRDDAKIRRWSNSSGKETRWPVDQGHPCLEERTSKCSQRKKDEERKSRRIHPLGKLLYGDEIMCQPLLRGLSEGRLYQRVQSWPFMVLVFSWPEVVKSTEWIMPTNPLFYQGHEMFMWLLYLFNSGRILKNINCCDITE